MSVSESLTIIDVKTKIVKWFLENCTVSIGRPIKVSKNKYQDQNLSEILKSKHTETYVCWKTAGRVIFRKYRIR